MSGNNNQDAIPDLTEYRWTYNSEGLITEYACKYLTSPEVAEYNNFEQVVVPSYFDLVYDCYDNPSALSDLIASRIVEAAAGHWHITPHGAVCDGTGESVDNNLIIAVSSQPGHSQIDRFSCQKLVPGEGECCTVVHNQMTFTPFPNYSEIDLWAYVAGRLDSGELVQPNETFQTRFIGSLIADEPPQDGTTVKGPAGGGSGSGSNGGSGSGVSAVQRGPQNSPGGSNNVTAVGGIILGGLMAVLVGLGIMFVRRRQQVHHDRQRRMHPDDLDSDDDYMVGVQVLSDRRNLNGMPDGLPAGVTGHEVLSPKHDASNDTDSNFRVNVTYHKSNDGSSSVGGHAPPPTTTATTADRSSSSNTRYRVKSLANSLSDVADDDDKDEYEDEVEYDSRGSSYAWDLSNSFQREIMGTHGGGSSSPTAYHNNSKSGSGSSSNNSSPRHQQQQQQQLQRTSTPEQFPPHQQQLPQPLPNNNNNNNNYYPHKGPTTIEVVPPYPMDETSESEADSWAQTDASVGSLDVKLEQITAEI